MSGIIGAPPEKCSSGLQIDGMNSSNYITMDESKSLEHFDASMKAVGERQ
jgi:hypothetical protein